MTQLLYSRLVGVRRKHSSTEANDSGVLMDHENEGHFPQKHGASRQTCAQPQPRNSG